MHTLVMKDVGRSNRLTRIYVLSTDELPADMARRLGMVPLKDDRHASR